MSLHIAGAPADRYWELGGRAVDLGAVGVAPSELARRIVFEYLLAIHPRPGQAVDGSDWLAGP